jgi:ribonuclease J
VRVRIHRGAHEIGGNCVEVEHEGQRIVLDAGRPLTADRDEEIPLPEIPGLAEVDETTLGILISHHHADHWGLVNQVRAGLPIYMGAATQRILAAASFWTRGLDVPVAGHLEHRVSFELGPFTVTPFLNDHSAFDAYSLLIEAGGRRLFYTGDIRGHGRKAAIFEELLRRPPAHVDVLLMEGTNIQPGLPTKPSTTESAVEHDLVDRFRDTPGLALVVTSAQNIDRLVTIYRASLRADRHVVMDAYSADIARATGNSNIPRPDPQWPRICTYLPRWQAVRIKEAASFDRLADINPYRKFPEHLADDPGRYVLLFSGDEGPRLAAAGALDGATCSWSLWDGYLEENSGQRLTAFLDAHDIPLAHHHTSGHASVEDLRRLADALDPGKVVPIHTFGGAAFGDIHDRIDPQPDGRWWGVSQVRL